MKNPPKISFVSFLCVKKRNVKQISIYLCKKKMYISFMKFEWDVNKEKLNIKKHGISFEQASYVFADRFALSIYDEGHSKNEDRWVLLGKTSNELILVVVHTFRDSNGIELVRIISARKATRNEILTYDKRRL